MIAAVDSPNETESQAEPNSGDMLEVIVPKAGAVVTNTLHCHIVVAPNGPFTVTGTYDDHSTFTVNVTNLPVAVSGPAPCPTAATTSSFQGTYIFSPGVSDAS